MSILTNTMSILTNIVAAEEDEVEAVGDSLQPVDEWSGISLRDIGIAKIATLHSLLTGDLFEDAAALCEPVYISPAEGALVLRLADELKDRLAKLDEESLDAVAAELAATEEFEMAGRDEGEVLAMLADLADLARLAESQDQTLFVWMHPLRT
ncbi:MAG: hypothetical protein IPP18_15515 [Rhodocyclaceae bacterium]|jgi:hypothetical protein|nr:hypothetical protein [Rhodocyclaceae bacterium]MBK6676012.1 hypothetical protein [Rhodocyclaceae bacterium]MBK9311365.1 hypothetical protein [Rhodocyclaceae bacterium]MBK9956477.1 hypothetical protein [Rhodocyclaceae bacterium]